MPRQDAARLARGGAENERPRERASGEVEAVWRRWTRGGQGGSLGGQPEVGENLGHDGRVFDGGEEAQATAAASIREDVDGA